MVRKYLLSCLLLICVTSFSAFSQKSNYNSTISLSVGQSMVGKIMNNINLGDSSNADPFALPAVNIAYDRTINNWFSIGGAFSFQHMGVKFTNYESTDENNVTTYVDFNTTINRINYAIRPLFHYGTTDKLDMYSGLRIGMISNTFHLNGEVAGFKKDDVFKFNFGARPTCQIIAFGLRYYFTDAIGFHTEFAIGSPYYFSAGLNIRL